MSGLRASILRWYLRHRRDLPWRRTRDPYAIWVSEIMLQQTRVETVIPYYERFLARFPTALALARATEGEVLAAWSGLGYYRRARNLHRASRVVAREHRGVLPRGRDALEALPGIGAYTAAAIASIAFGEAAAAVDGNVVRVIARLAGLRGHRTSARLARAVRERASALAGGPRPGDWTQALMELGATLCLPRDPLCARCPARRACAALESGAPDRFPEASPVKDPLPARRVLLVARRRGRVLLVPDPADRSATWTVPYALLESDSAERARRAAGALARRHLGSDAGATGPHARFRHRTFSHDWTNEVWVADPTASRSPSRVRTLWAREEDLDEIPVRSHTLKALRKMPA